MKTIKELWAFLQDVKIDNKPLPDSFMRDLQSFCLGGIEALPEMGGISKETDSQYLESHWANAEQVAVTPKYRFKFGAGSEKEMLGVDKRLVRVARRALELSTQDFTFFDGLRTLKEQQELVRRGASKTMQSKHLEGLAMDLVPYANGRPVWDWDLIYPVVMAVDQAATELGVAHLITWGGAWDRTLADFGGDADAYEKEVRLYCDRHPGKDFIDGPHFQIVGPKQ